MKEVLERIERLLIEAIAEMRGGLVPSAAANEWLRADEVMDLLSISRRTLYNYYIAGVFDTRLIAGTRFYAKASVMRLK